MKMYWSLTYPKTMEIGMTMFTRGVTQSISGTGYKRLKRACKRIMEAYDPSVVGLVEDQIKLEIWFKIRVSNYHSARP